MTTALTQILTDLDAAEQKCVEARVAIQNGDREKAIHSLRRIQYNALNASLLMRNYSDQAFPAATEHLRTPAEGKAA
jgi:outer membrane PBP1 activator LpoA protein